MAIFSCFSVLVGRKKKYKGGEESSDHAHYKKGLRTLKVKLEHPIKTIDIDGLNSSSFSVAVPFGMQENSTCKVKVVSDENPVGAEAAETAYEGGDENLSIKREFSDFDLPAQVDNKGGEAGLSMNRKMDCYDSINTEMNDRSDIKLERDAEVGVELIRSGNISDPGIGRAKFCASPKLKHSCSNLETREIVKKIADQLPPSHSRSFEDLQNLTEMTREEALAGIRGNTVSVMPPCSADRVMLKKHSGLRWDHQDHSQGSFTRESRNNDNRKWDNFHDAVSGLWPLNQWVAFSKESSSLTRVDEWVNSLNTQPPLLINDDDTNDEGIVFPTSPKTSRSPARSTTHMMQHPNLNILEVLHANSVIQSLNSSSTVAHITGMSLKVIPTISHLSSLRAVNLSGNFIVRITPGSLPKGLHTLNLSRNNIVAIEGLRELTQLRVLDLSYNRISQIGHGLSNCTLIKELYLAGNKIGNLEGLHRLFKLTVLDLSFNKITTARALGQLVANYNSLLALNLLGNPIQSYIGDEQLRKVVSGLLRQIAYLNKQPINPQRARQIAMDSVAKAALRNNVWTSCRKSSKRICQGGSSSSNRLRSSIGGGQTAIVSTTYP